MSCSAFHSPLAFVSCLSAISVHWRELASDKFFLFYVNALLHLISSWPFCSAPRELKVCWSLPRSRHSCPHRVLRGNLRQLRPARTTAPQWTLSPHHSSPQVAGPAILLAPPATGPLYVTPGLAPRKANMQRCIFPTQPLVSPFPRPVRTLATKMLASPLCTDWLKWRCPLVKPCML